MEHTENAQTDRDEQEHMLMEQFARTFNDDMPRLQHICSSYVPRDEVEDVLAKVRLEVLRYIKKHSKLPIQRNIDKFIEFRSIDRLRKLKQERTREIQLEDIADSRDPEDSQWEQQENSAIATQIAREVIRRLKREDALLFVFCILRGKKSNQLAGVVDLSSEAVRQRLHRIVRPTLRTVMHEHGYNLEGSRCG